MFVSRSLGVGGGGPARGSPAAFFAAIGLPVYQGYGLTEAAPIHQLEFTRCTISVPPTARAVKCLIRRGDRESKVGERGDSSFQVRTQTGYIQTRRHCRVLRDEADGRWLWTGDLGYYDEDGFLVVTGRAKALLIGKDGEKYSPEEVEEVMVNNTEILNQLLVYNDHKAITTALVTLQDDLIKKVVKDENLTTPEAVLKRIIELLRAYEPIAAKSIPSQWIPSRFAIIPKPFSEADGLVNSTMKLVRYKTIEFYQTRVNEMYESEDLNNQRNLEAVKELFFS